MDTQPLSVVMPAFNKAETIMEIINVVLQQPLVAELIVVDDCSSDDTLRIVKDMAEKDPRIQVHSHAVNKGKV